MTSKEWEKLTLEEDRKIRTKANKYRSKSSRRVVYGSIFAVFGLDTFNDVLKKVSKAVGEYSKSVSGDKVSLETISGGLHAIANGVESKPAITSLILILLAIAIFIWAMRTRNKAEMIDTGMLKWEPKEDEIADIRKRFDNEFVRGVLSKISPVETESVTVSLEGITIENNDGNVSYNFNKEGYKRLTNYESKQLAYFIGSEAFPDGFIIHNLKKHATAFATTARSYAEVGEIKQKAPNEEEVIKKNLRWLLKEVAKVTGLRKLAPKDEPIKAVELDGGHIVLNKGYSENSEKYEAL